MEIIIKEVFEDLKNKQILEFIRDIWISNFYNTGFEFIAENIFKRIPDSKNFEEILKIIEEEFNNKDFKKFNRKKRKAGNLNAFGYKLIENHLKNSESYLDFGCGRMALIRRICREDLPSLQRIYGYDPKAQMEYIAFDQKERVKFLQKINEVRNLENIDFITINYVLHHLTNEELEESIEVCGKILSKNGRILILEESFWDDTSFSENLLSSSIISKIDLIGEDKNESFSEGSGNFANIIQLSNHQLNQKFATFDKETKVKIIFLNDVLLNYKNLDYMPWTMNYKSIEEWRSLFKKKGFKVDNIQDFGFLKGQKQKGGTVSLIELK